MDDGPWEDYKMIISTFISYSLKLTYLAGVSISVFAMVFLFLTSISSAAHASTGQVKYSRDLIQQMIVAQAHANGTVPPALAMAVAKVESDFQAHVKSSAGARGVMQIMPATAHGEFGVKADRLWDPKLNIAIGIKYLENLYRQYDNRWDMALSHYNGGTIKGGRPHNYTRKYVSDVMGYWQQFQRSNVVLAMADTQNKKPSMVKVNKYNPTRDTGNRLNQRLAEDYWMLDDPKVEKNWREYLKVADRWLNHDGNGLPAGFDKDSIPYGGVNESNFDNSSLRARFRNSLKKIQHRMEPNGSARFM